MSWEGYEQVICKNGHYYNRNCMFGANEPEFCPYCSEEDAWRNIVDITNGSFDVNPITGEAERIDGYIELEIDKPEETQQCSCCGHVRVIKEATYKIPKKEYYNE